MAEAFSESFPSEPAFADSGSQNSPEGSESEDSGFGKPWPPPSKPLENRLKPWLHLANKTGKKDYNPRVTIRRGTVRSRSSEGQGQPSEGLSSESGRSETKRRSRTRTAKRVRIRTKSRVKVKDKDNRGEGQPSQTGETPPSGQSSPSPSSGDAPLTNPETAQALAQTLDSSIKR